MTADEREQLYALRRRVSELETEVARLRRRCYPTTADVREAGITPAQIEAMLDAHFTRDEPENVHGRTVNVWLRDGKLAANSFHAEWMAEAIGTVADLRGLDQWELFAELAKRAPPRHDIGACVDRTAWRP